MTPADLDRLDELAEKATPGPWEADGPIGGHYHYTVCAAVGTVCDVVCDCDDPVNGGRDNHDAAFIAAADPQTVRALVAEVRRLHVECAELIIRATTAEREHEAVSEKRRVLWAEVERLRRGVEQLTILLAAHETMPTAHSWGRATECMAHLLADREWDDNGTTAAMPRKGNDNGV